MFFVFFWPCQNCFLDPIKIADIKPTLLMDAYYSNIIGAAILMIFWFNPLGLISNTSTKFHQSPSHRSQDICWKSVTCRQIFSTKTLGLILHVIMYNMYYLPLAFCALLGFSLVPSWLHCSGMYLEQQHRTPSTFYLFHELLAYW